MLNINSTSAHQPSTASITSVKIKEGSARAENTVATDPLTRDDLQISDEAKVLMSLYESAGGYVRGQHMERYAGPVNGISPPSAYVNVERYNSYLFDKAAEDMVSSAKSLGFTLEKSDVLAQLKKDNSDIASIKYDDKARQEKLGSMNVMSSLSLADVDSFTDVYITAMENGLDLEKVELLAFERAVQNHWGGRLKEGDAFPLGWDFSETDPEKIEAAKFKVSESVTQQVAEIRAKLQGNLGLSNDFLQYLLNPRIGVASGAGFSLDFLSKLVDIHNQQTLAPAAASASPAVTREGQ
jgi:hypothetical protein